MPTFSPSFGETLLGPRAISSSTAHPLASATLIVVAPTAAFSINLVALVNSAGRVENNSNFPVTTITLFPGFVN